MSGGPSFGARLEIARMLDGLASAIEAVMADNCTLVMLQGVCGRDYKTSIRQAT